MIKLENWRAATSTSGEPLARKRKGRGGGFEYHRALVEQAIKDRGHRLLKVSLPLVLYLTQDELARLEAVSAKSKLPVKALALTFVRNGTAMLERIL